MRRDEEEDELVYSIVTIVGSVIKVLIIEIFTVIIIIIDYAVIFLAIMHKNDNILFLSQEHLAVRWEHTTPPPITPGLITFIHASINDFYKY